MSDCERFERILGDSAAAEAGIEALGELREHARACRSCRGLLESHERMTALGGSAPEPGEGGFASMREGVLSAIARGARGGEEAREATGLRERETRLPRPWWSLARTAGRERSSPAGWGSLTRAAAALAAAALLFVAGLAAGRVLRPAGGTTAGGEGAASERLVSAISAEAAGNASLRDVEESPYIYSNVSFRRLGDGMVALDFDVTTHVGLVEPAGSELVQEILAQSLIDPSSTGTRLRAISYATGALSPKVREALLLAMRRDGDLAVRLRALQILADHLGDPEVEAGVLATLGDDESVQMRLLALDCLAARGPDDAGLDRIRRAIRAGEAPGDEALMVRFTEHLKKF